MTSLFYEEFRVMVSTNNRAGNPAFYTVPEAARILRVTPATLYRAIRDDAFPAVRIRTRYVIPASAVDRLAAEAAEHGGCVDVAQMAAQRRTAREMTRTTGGVPW
jgi:excisionase family DNA binding protein